MLYNHGLYRSIAKPSDRNIRIQITVSHHRAFAAMISLIIAIFTIFECDSSMR